MCQELSSSLGELRIPCCYCYCCCYGSLALNSSPGDYAV